MPAAEYCGRLDPWSQADETDPSSPPTNVVPDVQLFPVSDGGLPLTLKDPQSPGPTEKSISILGTRGVEVTFEFGL
jgi:hypothetical protein